VPMACKDPNYYFCEYDCEVPPMEEDSFNRVAYLTSFPTTIYVQEVHGADFTLDSIVALPKNLSTNSIPRLPYIAYNYNRSALEVLGDWYNKNHYYHYFIKLDNTTIPEFATKYDGRVYSAFV